MLSDISFWAFVGLLLFIGLMIYMKVPGLVTGALDKRADTIRNELEQARTLREEAQAVLAEYQRRAREAESEAEEIVDQAKREAAAIATDAQQRMNEYVTSRTRQAGQKIAQAEVQAVQEVRSLSADVAIAAAERILAERMKGEAADSVIAAAIDDVKAHLN
ncbi:MAG: F0F1 ATP synthase subunit B family protein [Alphaproteobacteria bacterium]